MSIEYLAKDILALPDGIHYISCYKVSRRRAVRYDLIRSICPDFEKGKWERVEYYTNDQTCVIDGYGFDELLFAHIQARRVKLVLVIHDDWDDDWIGTKVAYGATGFYLDKTNASETQTPCIEDVCFTRDTLHKELEERKAILADIDEILLELNPPPSKRPN